MIETKPTVELEAHYSISQASAILKVAKTTLRRWLDEGLVDYKTRKIDHKRIIKGKALVQLWEEMEE